MVNDWGFEPLPVDIMKPLERHLFRRGVGIEHAQLHLHIEASGKRRRV